MKSSVIKYIDKKYTAVPEYLWRRYPTFCVFRHTDNKKWFALIGTLPRSILKLSGDGDVDFINLKTDNTEFLLGVSGILPAYHMNKTNWITVILDGTLPLKNVQKLIDLSYELTA